MTVNGSARARARHGPHRPNIVLIVADDLGYGDMGIYGNSVVSTPHLDRLASQGTRLTQHYSGSPMCAPARAALLTGKYPHRTGAVSVEECLGLDRISLRDRTLADLLRSAGYATGMVGKWHNGAVDPRYHPNARGFEEVAGFLGGWISYWDWILDYNGTYRRADGRYLTDVFTTEALGFIERHAHHPFLLYLAYNAPHTPFEAPEEEVARFADWEDLTEPVKTVYAMVSRMDKGIGAVLDALGERGLKKQTFVLFTSDNGPDFFGQGASSTHRYNGQFAGSKGHVHEGGIRVPAIVSWPENLADRSTLHDLVHFTDWLPTLLDVADVSPPRDLDLDGASIVDALHGASAPADRPRFWQWNRYTPVPRCNAAMRDGDWKLYLPSIPEAMQKRPIDDERSSFVINNPGEATEIWHDPVQRALSPPRDPMLFNLADDPYEKEDLSAQFPDRLLQMERKLERWFDKMEGERQRITE